MQKAPWIRKDSDLKWMRLPSLYPLACSPRGLFKLTFYFLKSFPTSYEGVLEYLHDKERLGFKSLFKDLTALSRDE